MGLRRPHALSQSWIPLAPLCFTPLRPNQLDQRPGRIDPELVEQFQVCLGVYPTGSLVELNSGEVAVVMAHNQVSRLRPKLLVLSTPAKQA